MELMVFSMLVIIVVLMTYMFTEQSVLRRTMWIDPLEHWQEYFNAIANWREAELEINVLLDAAESAEPSWFEKLFRPFR